MLDKTAIVGVAEEPNFLMVVSTAEANEKDLANYRLERFSDTKNAWILVRRKSKVKEPIYDKLTFKEVDNVEEANEVDMKVYRFECFSETRGCWMFVKRRVVE